jgi:DNA polymerase-4
MAKAKRLCPQAVFMKGNHTEYSRMSREMREVFCSFTPDIEMASLDEAYLDLTGCMRMYASGFETAERIKQAVKRKTGLNVSIGVSASKLLAKVASDYAKPNGIAYVWPGYEARFLRPLSLKELPGVGPRTLERLERYNLRRIGDVQDLSPEALKAALGPAGEALFERAGGIDSGEVEEALFPKSISRETTFDEDTADRRLMEAMLSYLAERAAHKLRMLDMRAKTVSVKIRYSDFSTYHMARSLKEPSHHDADFRQLAFEIFDRLFTRRMRVRLVGVALSSLVPEAAHQGSLFEEERFRKRERLYRGIDRVRERFGFSALFTGRAVELLPRLDRNEHGFILRTPSLTR